LGFRCQVNFLKIDRASSTEYDVIEKLGNPGWNWESFLKYFKKSENLHLPSKKFADEFGLQLDPEAHGTDGPLQVTFSEWITDVHKPFINALNEVGLEHNPEPSSGYNIGITEFPGAIDKGAKRSYSATAYYRPAADRKNLVILCEAVVSRIELLPLGNGGYRADGAHFIHNSVSHYAKAGREVILSAGTLKSPHILELSGIGSKQVLVKVGLKSIIDLPGVGENLQDHPLIPVDFKIRSGIQTGDALSFDEKAVKQHTTLLDERGVGYYAATHLACAFLGLKDVVNEEDGARYHRLLHREEHHNDLPSWKDQFKILTALSMNDKVAPVELVLIPKLFVSQRVPQEGISYCSILLVIMHPSSRGWVHAQSADPTADPCVDEAYLDSPSDLEMAKFGIRHILRLAQTKAWGNITSECLFDSEISKDSKDPIEDHCRQWVSTCFHWIGTASMMPREKGGVVDPQLKVYGTSNLRVVDASVIPIHLSCHNSATVYALAEKAADIIKDASSGYKATS